MTKEEYVKRLISVLTVIDDVHDFSQGPLGQKTKVLLSSLKNEAEKLGLEGIKDYLAKALRTDDATAQQVLLFTGIQKDSGVSDKDIKSLMNYASDSYRNNGGDPDRIKVNIQAQLQQKREEEESEEEMPDDLGVDGDADEILDDMGMGDEETPEEGETDSENPLGDVIDSLSMEDEEDEEDEEDQEEEIGEEDLDADDVDPEEAMKNLGIDLNDDDDGSEKQKTDDTSSSDNEDDRVAKEAGDDEDSEPARDKENLSPLYDAKNRYVNRMIDRIFWGH
jgi:hypothetical protein